jgi:hypothetical protein
MPAGFLLLLLVVVLGLQGCASLSEDECLSADWYTIGYEDGLRGHTPIRIADHRKACASHGVSPDLARYASGREAGLKWYCEPRNGFRLGVKGQAYTGACPAQAESPFLVAWSAGKEIHDTEYQLRRLDKILAVNHEQLDNLVQDRQLIEAELVHRGTTWQRRAELLLELHELEENREMVENEIGEIESAISRERAHLLSLRQNARHWETAEQTSRR